MLVEVDFDHRHAALVWRGTGRTAFAAAAGAMAPASAVTACAVTAGVGLPAGLAPPTGKVRPTGTVLSTSTGPRWVATGGGLEALFRAEGSPPLRTAMNGYFTAGGHGAYLFDEPRFRDEGWIGEDGAPGSTSGIYLLAEMEDVSTLVLPGVVSRLSRERVLELAGRRPGLFFFLVQAEDGGRGGAGLRLSDVGSRGDGLGSRGDRRVDRKGEDFRAFTPDKLRAMRVSFLAPNVAEVCGPLTAGALAGHLESTDFQMDAPSAALEWVEPPLAIDERDLLRLKTWRCREGLRRSIDWGTRWLVFELHHPLVWRRVEREVSAFLHRLAQAGFLSSSRGAVSFAVTCEPAPVSFGLAPCGLNPDGMGRQDARAAPSGARERDEVHGVVLRVRAALKSMGGRPKPAWE